MLKPHPLNTHESASDLPIQDSDLISITGTLNRTFCLLGLLGGTAYMMYAHWYTIFLTSIEILYGTLIFCSFLGLALASITDRFPHLAKWIAPLYAVVTGIQIGLFSFVIEIQYPGIMMRALSITASVILALCILYYFEILRPSYFLYKFVGALAFGILIFYVIQTIGILFGYQMINLWNGSPMALGISIATTLVATFTFLIQMDYTIKFCQLKQPQYMEWYAAFGLMASIVWLYMEIVRLLVNLMGRNKRR